MVRDIFESWTRVRILVEGYEHEAPSAASLRVFAGKLLEIAEAQERRNPTPSPITDEQIANAFRAASN